MSGEYQFQFIYDETICGLINDFMIYDLSNLTQGFDSPDDDDLAIYPSNIDVTIDDETRLNFLKFETLKKAYPPSYPFNFEDIFCLNLYRNGSEEPWFKGILQECSQGVRGFTNTLNFVDGINKTKDVSLANPAVLEKLNEEEIINRVGTETAWGYGYGGLYYLGNSVNGQWIDFPEADRDTHLKTIIEKLFKLLNEDIEVEFQLEFSFKEAVNNMYEVPIDDVKVKRVSSNLFGRFITMRKDTFIRIARGVTEWEYTYPEKYIKVYEDDDWLTFYHDWEGNFPEGINTKVHHKGVNERKLNDFLKFLARNLFCYFGFSGVNKVFWRHKRFVSAPVVLSRILDIDANTTIDKINSVTVKGLNNKNEHSEGYIYDGAEGQNLNISIPFTVEATDNGYESWLYFNADNSQHQIVKIRDNQTGYTEFIQKVIARNEYELKNIDRKKIVVDVEGVDHKFSDTFYAKHKNVEYIFRPIMMEKDLKLDKTKITGVEIGS